MPNFASRYHSGAWYFAKDCQSGWKGPSTDSFSTVASSASRRWSYGALAFCHASSIWAAVCETVLWSLLWSWGRTGCASRGKDKSDVMTLRKAAWRSPDRLGYFLAYGSLHGLSNASPFCRVDGCTLLIKVDHDLRKTSGVVAPRGQGLGRLIETNNFGDRIVDWK